MDDRAMEQARALADAEQPHPAKRGSRHHLTMIRYYGETPGQTCGGCARLWRLHYENAPYKCEAMTYTFGHDTDWGKGWQACGKWEARDWRAKQSLASKQGPADALLDDLEGVKA